MQKTIGGISETVLWRWITTSIKEGRNVLGRGYQGNTYIFSEYDRQFVIKAPQGRGLAAFIRRQMIANEYKVYTALSGMEGIPICHGLLRNKYLVLEFVDGIPIKDAPLEDRTYFSTVLLRRIKQLHQLGVAHGDLKKKDNILVVNGRDPILLDFGVAVIRKNGLAPINHFLYELFRKFDYNAYIKVKYGKRQYRIDDEDRQYDQRTLIEKAAGWIKRSYLKCKNMLPGI
jgi:predicted Ser/Thr protein kinase